MATMDRRTFLARSAVAAGAVGAAAVVGGRILRHPQERPWDEAAFAPPGTARVAVLRATSYDAGLDDVVGDGLRAIGADVRGARVLLKPNLVEFDEDTAINTDPRLVAAAVVALRRMGAADVVVGEGPGHRRDTQFVVTSSGLLEALDAVDARFVDLNIDGIARVPLRSRYTALGALWLPRAITDADVVISMPKMKTHHWAGLTLSLKNCFGCVPGRVYGWPKNALHWAGLEQAILDVAAAVRPDYAIVDGIVGMEGNGPDLRHAGGVERPRVRRRSGGDGRGRRSRDGVRPREGLVPRGGGAVPRAGRHGSDPHRGRGRGRRHHELRRAPAVRVAESLMGQ